MSFSIIFQKNNSPNNQLDKNLTTVTTLTGTLRNESNIINPTILIEYDGYLDANYFTISTFKRSYFITEMRSIRNMLWEVTGHCDVLSSFKTEIRQNTVIAKRQQNIWDLYLDDGLFKADVNPMVVLKKFPNALTNYEYILAVAGGGSSS